MLFTASWCQPCQVLKARLRGIDLSSYEFKEIECTDANNANYARLMGVRAYPTLVIVDGQAERKRSSGSPADLAGWLAVGRASNGVPRANP